MSRRQFVGLIGVVVVGFAAVVAAGWISDRAAQDSNRKAIVRLQDSVQALEDGLSTQIEQNAVSVSASNATAAADIESEIDDGLADVANAFESALETALESAVQTLTEDRETSDEAQAALLRGLNSDVVEVLEDIEDEVSWSGSQTYCNGLRRRQSDVANRYFDAANVYIQVIYQSRLNALAISSVLARCGTLLYP